MNPITEILATAIRGMCEQPEDCNITEGNRGRALVIRIAPDPKDFGIVCGTDGRQIKALKFLAARAGEIVNDEIIVELAPTEPIKSKRFVFVQDPAFDEAPAVRLVEQLVGITIARPVEIKAERSNDLLTITVDTQDGENVTVAQIATLLHGYGNRHGCVIKVVARKTET